MKKAEKEIKIEFSGKIANSITEVINQLTVSKKELDDITKKVKGVEQELSRLLDTVVDMGTNDDIKDMNVELNLDDNFILLTPKKEKE